MKRCRRVAWFMQWKVAAVILYLIADMFELSIRVPVLVLNMLMLATLNLQYGEYALMALSLFSAAMPPTNASTMRLYVFAVMASLCASAFFQETRKLTIMAILIPWLVFEALMLDRKDGRDASGVDSTRIALRVRALCILAAVCIYFAMYKGCVNTYIGTIFGARAELERQIARADRLIGARMR